MGRTKRIYGGTRERRTLGHGEPGGTCRPLHLLRDCREEEGEQKGEEEEEEEEE